MSQTKKRRGGEEKIERWERKRKKRKEKEMGHGERRREKDKRVLAGWRFSSLPLRPQLC